MGLFDKKYCDICGDKIGLLGNRKLEDGNCCKSCAAKLSPWFSERKSSTVAEIKEQLAYREANREAVAAFQTTRTFGKNTKIYIDDNAGKFMVTAAKSLESANPDVMDISSVTGCSTDVTDSRTEIKRKGADNKEVSFVPPHYEYHYSVYQIINVNNPYFSEIRFQLSDSITMNAIGPAVPSPNMNIQYKEAMAAAAEIKTALSGAVKAAAKAAAPKTAVTCPHCGATTIPDINGCCEYCGGSVKG